MSCHGNPLHPNDDVAQLHRQQFRDTVRVAEKIGVRRVITFSGCPGDSDGSQYPNWVTCPWPPDFLRILDWQWNEKVIPYWQEEVAFCRDHGVDMISLEMHPGFNVYNPETMLHLRDAVGPEMGCNFDPAISGGRASTPSKPFANSVMLSSMFMPKTPKSTRTTPGERRAGYQALCR